jgi:CRISPR-associated protein Csc3
MRLLNRPPRTLEERYFSEIRPHLYKLHASHRQSGVRQSRTLAEHLDSVCQFVLTVSQITGISDDKRAVILAAAAVHDLNKLDESKRSVKTLARNKEFLREQLEKAGVSSFVTGDAELELARRLIERHSGHHPTDGTLFLPEDPQIQRWASILIAADLFDLDLPSEELIPKVRKELVSALGRPSELYRIRIAEDRGYMTALLLTACEEILAEHGLIPLAIFPDGALFEGESFPEIGLTQKIVARWQLKINGVFGSNIEQLVKPTKDGVKILAQAVQHDSTEIIKVIFARLEKKKADFKADKVQADINKWSSEVEESAIAAATALGLLSVSNAEEFALAEGLKAAYLSYRQASVSTKETWDKIATHIGLSALQRAGLEPLNPQYGRPLFAAKASTKGFEGIQAALIESLELRKASSHIPKDTDDCEISEEVSEGLIELVSKTLNLPISNSIRGFTELTAYINANPRHRCSLGATTSETEDVSSMPTGTKVQVFSNRLPGGMGGDPRRQAEPTTLLAYQLLAIGANFPAVKKEPPFYLHLILPEGSCPELLRIWRECLREFASTNAEGGTVAVDVIKLYRDNIVEFRADKAAGFAFPKRPEFVHASVTLPLVWGDANASIALLKSLRLTLELSLSLEFGFPFVLSSSLQIEPSTEFYGRVEGVPTAFANLLGYGQYNREESVKVRDRLRWLGNLVQIVSNLSKFDDCLYDLARATSKPFSLYYVLLRWILREQDDPNFEILWKRIREPLNHLLESLMPNENAELTKYLKEAAQLAAEASLRGSSFKRTAITEPFTAFLSSIRSIKPHMDLDFVFASLSQKYHTRLDRIREHSVGETKLEQIKQYYGVLRKLYESVYHARPEKLLSDREDLEAAYLFFWQEAYQVIKAKRDAEKAKAEANESSESTQAIV